MNISQLSKAVGLLALAAMTAPALLFAGEGKIVTGDPNLSARNLSYHFGNAVPIYTQRRWSTILYLDKNETILDAVMADKDNFELHTEKNVNFITVNTKADSTLGAKTNLSLFTGSGNIYTVAIFDVTGKPDMHADTQVNLDASGDQQMKSAMNAPARFVPADQVNALKTQLGEAEKGLQAAKVAFEEKLRQQQDVAQAAAIKEVKSGYEFNKARAKPFEVYSMTDNGKFTILKTHAAEQFAVYETKDGKPVAINMFPDGDGTIRLDRIVDTGYFQIGKKRAAFARQTE